MTGLAGEICARTVEAETADERGRGVMRPGGLVLTSKAIGRLGLRAGARVVDVGCGTGVSVEYLRSAFGFDAIGIDSSGEALERGSRRSARVPLVLGSGAALPFADQSMAGVLMECSLSVMSPEAKVLAECGRVLVPGGRLAISDLYSRGPGERTPLAAPWGPCAARMTTREELDLALREHGFRVEVFEDHSPMLTELACRLVMALGSLPPGWAHPSAKRGERRHGAGVQRARPGYFLLAAVKQ
jgi:SAM-dependent methyltransferase